MKLPTQNQCLELFQQYKVPHHIFEHCLNVGKLALFLAKKLRDSGESINLELVYRIALLHDLFKAVTLEELKPNSYYPYPYSPEEIKTWQKLRHEYAGMHECEIAYLVLKKDFPELALAIKNASNPLVENKSPEENLAHYADWRIFNNEIVSLDKRLAYLRERYLKGEEYWKERLRLILKVEGELFSRLPFSPEGLEKELKRELKEESKKESKKESKEGLKEELENG